MSTIQLYKYNFYMRPHPSTIHSTLSFCSSYGPVDNAAPPLFIDAGEKHEAKSSSLSLPRLPLSPLRGVVQARRRSSDWSNMTISQQDNGKSTAAHSEEGTDGFDMELESESVSHCILLNTKLLL